MLPCQKSTLEDEPSTSLSWSQSISTSQLGIASIYVSSKFKEIFTLYSWHHCCSVAKLCLTLCDHVNCSRPGSPVLHYLPEFAQIHIHWVGDAIQPSHPLSSPSPPALNLSHHQGLLQWVSSSHQVAKVLELQLQHQSFQWIFRADSSFCIDWSPYTPRDSQESSPLAQFNVSIHWHSAFFII